jgi:uncharacterized protein (TIGR00730 family)
VSGAPAVAALRAVCVFCGSQAGVRAEYRAEAHALGAWLAQHGIEVVFGGGHVGLMGALADAALAAGGRVTGVIPEHLMRPELAHRGLSELIVVDTMHTRKRTMASRADAFIVLPGGYGTFEEMFEMITWLQLRLQPKPVGLLNVAGYFDRLIDFLHHAADEGFIRAEHRELWCLETDAARLAERLRQRIARGARARSHLERS